MPCVQSKYRVTKDNCISYIGYVEHDIYTILSNHDVLLETAYDSWIKEFVHNQYCVNLPGRTPKTSWIKNGF
jgi:hypothetical protein